MEGADAINAYMGHSAVQDTTNVTVVRRMTHNHMTIDAQDANGKTRYNSAVLYRKQSGKLRAGLVTKLMQINNTSLVLMQKTVLYYEGLKNILHLADDAVDALRSRCLCAKIVNTFEVVSLSAIHEKCVYLPTTGHSTSAVCFFSRFPSHLLRDQMPPTYSFMCAIVSLVFYNTICFGFNMCKQ